MLGFGAANNSLLSIYQILTICRPYYAFNLIFGESKHSHKRTVLYI